VTVKDIDKQIAEIFEVPASGGKADESDESHITGQNKVVQTFEQKAQDVQAMMEAESEEIELVKEPEPVKVEPPQIPVPEPVLEVVEHEQVIKSAERITQEKPKPEIVVVEEPDSEIQPKTKIKTINISDEEEKPKSDNPLNLFGKDLDVYNFVTEKYPQFQFYDNHASMRLFYKFKVKELGYVLNKFPLMNISSYIEEIKNVNLDFSVPGVPDPLTLANKLNQVIRARTRLTQILFHISSQLKLWQRCQEMLEGKLFLEKEIKGQQKRGGLVLEYMADVVHYVSEMEGLNEAAKRVEDLLSANYDSISRQIACLQTFKDTKEFSQEQRFDTNKSKSDTNKYSNLDSVSSGEVVKGTNSQDKKVFDANFGVDDADDDDFLG